MEKTTLGELKKSIENIEEIWFSLYAALDEHKRILSIEGSREYQLGICKDIYKKSKEEDTYNGW